MKKCPFCAEEIQPDAVKCRFCGEFLEPVQQASQSCGQPKPKWYFRSGSLIVGFLIVGPFILPMIWAHPTFSQRKKVILTIVVIGITLLLLKATASALGMLSQYYGLIQGSY